MIINGEKKGIINSTGLEKKLEGCMRKRRSDK